MFTQIEGAYALVRRKGRYRQVNVYSLRGQIFVKLGADYAYLMKDYVGEDGKIHVKTSIPDLLVTELVMSDIADDLVFAEMGRIMSPTLSNGTIVPQLKIEDAPQLEHKTKKK